MKISTVESLHCDAGWRNFSFLKITTDDGIVGYSEYNQSYGSKGVSTVIDQLSQIIIGLNPLDHDVIFATLYATTRQAPGGINAQAIAAIENALLDVKGKALGVPVYQLLGGAMRDRLRLYWSHCGTYRMHESTASYLGKEPMKSLDDVRALGEEVRDRGFTGLKCNMYVFGERTYTHGWRRSFPERNAERPLIRSVYNQIEAFNEGTGGDVDILIDLNFNFNPEGYIRMIRKLTPLELFWCELDIYNPEALAYIRNRTDTPIASCESIYGIRDFRQYFQMQSMDVAIVDVPWNGIWQSYKIAALADAHEVNVAPHNFYGHLSTMMSAHFCAAVPNFRIMEIDIDDVPWKDDLVTHPPEIVDGHLIVPDGPGWGCDIDEDAVRAHPPK
ncbi:MAG: mandelate racemase/muconate lactonizing enzyme family protein [Proteobacteria bacterium]|nr:mandelate racemase/muconate lactonizing enzyme family protein [Pseudomonadota bacterium]